MLGFTPHLGVILNQQVASSTLSYALLG